jgi:hypothetical protein
VRRIALVAITLVLLLVPSSASAQVQSPSNAGIHARLVNGTIVSMRFEPRLHRQVAGRRVTLSCTRMPPATGPGRNSVEIGEETFRLPKARRRVRRFVGPGYDHCTIYLRRRQQVVTFALNEQGAVHVDEQMRAVTLFIVLSVAGEGGELLTPDEFRRTRFGRALVREQGLVTLASPSDTPPADAIGYYSDGAEHAAAVIVSAAGRRLFVEVDADDVLHTNVAQYLFQ